MTTYLRRRLTYRPIYATPENEAEINGCGFTIEELDGGVLVFCIEMDRAVGVCTIQEFEQQYEAIED
jgi:hypothetical protein